MKILSNEQRAWAAGIMDGEGSFMISYRPPDTQSQERSKWGTNKTGKYPRRTPGYLKICSVPNTSLKLVRLFKSWFGGSITTVKMPEDTNQKQLYVWRISATHDVRTFIGLVKPYLFLKRRHAEILLEFTDTVVENYKNIRISEDTREYRQRLWEEIKILNHRGRTAAETKRRDRDDTLKR